VTEHEVHVWQFPVPVRVIRFQHPVFAATRRTIAEFLERDRVRQIVAAAFGVPLPLLGPAQRVSPGR
jgi:hypothetical protein